MSTIVSSFAEISGQYDAAFVDLWGCVHNGVTAFPDAVEALRAFRAAGGAVALVTNAPRARDNVERQLETMNVPSDCYDTIATSGDSARVAMFHGAIGEKVWFMGQDFDRGFFEAPKIVADPTPVTQVELGEATGIACCGPFDPHADPETLRPQLLVARERGIKLLCANPDIMVDRGERREWCAGAIAQLYTEMGGESLYFGKPHPPIYDLARRRLSELGKSVDDDRIIAVGDGILTDVRGASGEGLDCLFITGGLAQAETQTKTDPDPDALNAFLAKEQMSPRYSIGFLR